MRTIDSDERTTMGVLDVDECMVLLRWEPIGRLAFGVRGQAPIVVPVNFCIRGDTIVFRSDEGSKLELVREQPVSLQADRFDWFRRIGWSVLVRGVAHELSGDELADIDVTPWAPGRKPHWMSIVPTAITGRRLELTEGPLDNRGYV
jgi:nitroimidazol reductase NimA-like FMN-containing flavoprotein (pyridoxamine 5'-phosphate oxidase superfamily)